MKLLFLKESELSAALCELQRETDVARKVCSIGFSEEQDTDVVVYQGEGVDKGLPLQNFIPDLSEHYHVNIASYDVMEVGDFGEGFVFFLQ